MEVEVARPVPTMMESVSKKVQLKTRGKVFGVVREQYLRTGCIILYLYLHQTQTALLCTLFLLRTIVSVMYLCFCIVSL